MTEAPESVRDEILQEVAKGLCVPEGVQKTLPPWLFYDAAGSALFEQITGLPEYYLTRTEHQILEQNADAILKAVGSPVTVAELGSGTAAKTGLLLAAATRRQGHVLYQPIDVSMSSLDEATASMSAISGVKVQPQLSNYITNGYKIFRPKDHYILALYIGSSIGNFGPQEARNILRKLRQRLASEPGDGLLLGVDLAPCITKTIDLLLAAYDDAAGVTAAFNKNILARLNRELGTDFNLDAFTHRARWNEHEGRIEMHLESKGEQTVHIGDQSVRFLDAETIHTENSYKFTERGIRELLHDSGFSSPQWFQDPKHHFGVALAYPA